MANHPPGLNLVNPWHLHLLARASTVLVVLTALTYALSPEGVGYYVYLLSSSALMFAISAPVLLRNVTRHRAPLLVALAILTVMLTVAETLMHHYLGPFYMHDVPTGTCYFFILAWVLTIGGTGTNEGMALDALSACLGTAMAVWVLILAPNVTNPNNGGGFFWAVMPLFSSVFLALTAHVVIRQGRFSPPLAWLCLGVLLLFGLDLYAFNVTVHFGVGLSHLLAIGYLLAKLCLVYCAAHPGATQLAHPVHPGRYVQRLNRSSALVIVALVPSIFAVTIPVKNTADVVIRGVLMTGILLCVAARQRITLKALAQVETESHYRAAHDTLTGLYNRSSLIAELDLRLIQNRFDGNRTAVLFLDCDDFKDVNDEWGHEAGDAVLQAIARRVPTVLAPGDLFGRHGGDEFLIASTVSGVTDAKHLAKRVREVCRAPVTIHEDRQHVVTLSIGIAIAEPDSNLSTEQVICRADAAMYVAKDSGRGHTYVFDNDMAEETRLRARTGQRLGEAIQDGTITTVLQPIMGGPGYTKVVGFEALARWADPELGPVTPEVFVALAEELGYVRDLSKLVLDSACRQIAEIRAEHPEQNLFVTVNISPMQLRRSGLLDDVRKALHRAKVPPEALRLEVIETAVVKHDPAVDTMVRALHNAGVGLWIDDFGAGYASLTTLLRLPVDCLKIDRSLVRRVGRDPEADARLEAVLHLVRSLQIPEVVVEGVETETQANALADLGVQRVQGWLYGRAAPALYWMESLRLTQVLRN